MPLPAPALSELHVRPDRDRLVLAPTGDLDVRTADRLRAALADALADGWTEVVVDLRGLDFLDSQGAHVLVDARAAYEDRGARLTLADDAPGPMRVLDLLGVRASFTAARWPVPG